MLAVLRTNGLQLVACGIGMLLLLANFLYKAFHWKKYEKDNKRSIAIVLFTIIFIILLILVDKMEAQRKGARETE